MRAHQACVAPQWAARPSAVGVRAEAVAVRQCSASAAIPGSRRACSACRRRSRGRLAHWRARRRPLPNPAVKRTCLRHAAYLNVVRERHSPYGQWLAEWKRGGVPRGHAPAVPVSRAGGGGPFVEQSARCSVRLCQSQGQCYCCRFLHNPSLKRTAYGRRLASTLDALRCTLLTSTSF
jgi:hypothetical protein